MNHILTLVSARPGILETSLLKACTSALGTANGPAWLTPGFACDIAFALEEQAELGEIAGRIAGALGDYPVDFALQPAAAREKKLLIADMDSTIIQQECIDELGAACGLKDRISAITERAMRGEIDFEKALLDRVSLIAGLDVAVIADIIETRITLSPGAETLVATMRAHGADTALVSGGFLHFVEPIAKQVGFAQFRANELLEDNGKLTGDVARPILGADAKLSALRELAAQNRIPLEQTLAIGDGANDLPMLKSAGLGVAYKAKPAVAAAAHARITHGDLTVALSFQGIPDTAFVTA